jgi:hypothetical protein
LFAEKEEKNSPTKRTATPSAAVSPEKKRVASPVKRVAQKPSPPPPAAAAKSPLLTMEASAYLTEKRFAEAQKQHQDAQDLVIRTNRLLAESVENMAKIDTKEKVWLLDATRNLHALTAAIEAGNAQNAQLMKDLMTTVSQQQQTIMRFFEKLPLPVATAGRARAPAPEVAAPKGLDNESKSDRAKRIKKEKEEAAAAAAGVKKDDNCQEEKKVTAGDKRKADASPEREKKAPASKIKTEHPAEKKQHTGRAPPVKKQSTTQKKKKNSSKSDDESNASSSSESEEEDDAPSTPPKKKKIKSESPAPTQAQPMDD